ncbi:MAG: glycoside hydrolase family 38 C-terminal domain-containing protein [Phycisphaerales bacterium]
MPDKPESKAYIINHTHWDREWRYSMWQTRFMLVEVMDELIEHLESGKCKSFLMDGQVSSILDYLEVRPEQKNRLKKLISLGKLEIGPWYTLPDEFPVDGESLVRNLLWGDRLSKQLGGCLKVGYTSFGWGQTAQLSQIYRGFGIDVGFIGKKVNHERAPKSEFLWRAPDGSTMLTSRFGEWGRHNFYMYLYLRAMFGIDYFSANWCYYWNQDAVIYHRADQEFYEQDMSRIDTPEKYYPEMITPECADRLWATTDESEIADHRLMMNGVDYAGSQKFLADIIQKLVDVDIYRNRIWKQASLREFVDIMREKINIESLNTVDGELRDGPAAFVTGNALMTRNYLKFLNKKAQNRLIRFAEPLSVFASMQGAEFPDTIIKLSWKYLLDSHSHDSINGVTQDVTADAVKARLKQSIELSDAIGDNALKQLVKKIDMSCFDRNDVIVVVFNPLPYDRRELVQAWINVPVELKHNKVILPTNEGMQIFNSKDEPIDTQWISAEDHTCCIQEVHSRPFPFYNKRHRVVFDAGIIPAGGYKLFRVGRKNENRKDVKYSDLWSQTGDILIAPNIMENEHLLVEFNTNGTFDLTDKELNHTFANLNYYEDAAEHGHYWANERAMNVQTYNSLCCQSRLWTQESGPLQATIVSEVIMSLPSASILSEQRRCDQMVDMTIRTYATLKAKSRQVDIRVEFENRHKDHTLRVMLPTGIEKAEKAFTGGHFNVEERSICPQGPQDGGYWVDMACLPHDKFVDVSDGKVGFAVLNDCFVEYEVGNTSQRILCLTLLRAVRNAVCTDMHGWTHFKNQDGGQCIGKHTVQYAIRTHKDDWQKANIPLYADLFNAPVWPVQTRRHEGILPTHQVSFLHVENPMIRFSALKKCHDRDTYVLRLYNPTPTQQNCEIAFGCRLLNAWLCNLNEERESQIKPVENKLMVIFEPKKIKTIEIECLN